MFCFVIRSEIPAPTIKTITNGNQSPELYGDSHSNPSTHSETYTDYIGPPPPLPQKSPHLPHQSHPIRAPHQHQQPQQQQHQQHQKQQQIQHQLQQQQQLQSLSQLHPMPLPQPPHLAKATSHFNKIQMFRNKPLFVANKPSPPHLKPAAPSHQLIANQVHMNRIRAHQNHLNKEPGRLAGGQPSRPNLIPLSHVLPTPNIQNAHGPTPPNIPTPNIPVPTSDMHKYVLNNVAGGVNDIIEIQRIPEGMIHLINLAN